MVFLQARVCVFTTFYGGRADMDTAAGLERGDRRRGRVGKPEPSGLLDRRARPRVPRAPHVDRRTNTRSRARTHSCSWRGPGPGGLRAGLSSVRGRGRGVAALRRSRSYPETRTWEQCAVAGQQRCRPAAFSPLPLLVAVAVSVES